jgi:hypothetical protein
MSLGAALTVCSYDREEPEEASTMSPDELVSFGRRFEYLTAVEEYWPKVLASLQDPTFRVYRECRTRNENSCALRTLGDLLTTLRDGTSPELQPVQEALQQWTQAHDIRDPWIWDAAVQSMDHWARGGTVGRWTCRPKELQTPRFQPRFGVWIPYFMKWVDFKTATDRIYRSDLTRYRAEVRKLWGEASGANTRYGRFYGSRARVRKRSGTGI